MYDFSLPFELLSQYILHKGNKAENVGTWRKTHPRCTGIKGKGKEDAYGKSYR
jgi:hypothetical protein